MLSGFKSGELDYIQEAPQAELPNLIASGDMKIVDYLGTYYVCFQTQKAPFDNPKVREAFTLAVDRNYIVEKVTQSGQVEAGAYVPSGISDAEEGSDFRKNGGDYLIRQKMLMKQHARKPDSSLQRLVTRTVKDSRL